ncbi:aldo/keto reductase [Euzebya sp.]|uniref:aldo/keto reductase n=1 Tax=Euzebya sp. TaxID=1971409 RepID=UPI003511D8E0
MEYRLLGPTGLRVSEAFLGTMTFGEGWGWGAPPEECRAMLDAYLEAGGNVVDTAINYTDGASERIVGELLEGRRDRVVLSTKYTLSTDGADPNAAGNHRMNLIRSLEESLRRLRTDHVDLYWVHIWDPHTPVEETMRALDDAVRAGKVRYIGLSDTPAWVVARAQTLAEWRGWTPLAAIQVPYSLIQRDVERELLGMAEGLGLGVATWGALAGGVLSGKFTRPEGPEGSTRVDPSGLSERDRSVARAVQDVADGLGVSAAQVALAWVRSRSPRIIPILGARRLAQLQDNLAALEVVLDEGALARLEEAAPIELGFPLDFLAETASYVYGEAGRRVRGRAG